MKHYLKEAVDTVYIIPEKIVEFVKKETMQREMKFRAWHKIAKVIIPDEKLKNLRYSIKNENVVVMQYTGLKDCNGKEIYEGDIFIMDEVIWQVYFNGISAGFQLKSKDRFSSRSMGCRMQYLEIIGNIYETT